MTQPHPIESTHKTVIIAGSAKLVESVSLWRDRWTAAGYEVIDYPQAITPAALRAEYPARYERYYLNLIDADIVFVLNEDRGDQIGYVGAGTFAELAFAVACNRVMPEADQRVILYKPPGSNIQGSDEITLWLENGWVELLGSTGLLQDIDVADR